MQGLASGLARRLNRKLGRRGTLFPDRYHARALRSPSEGRNGLVDVLKNHEKHVELVPDPAARRRTASTHARRRDGSRDGLVRRAQRTR
jgi:hypothetical protein